MPDPVDRPLQCRDCGLILKPEDAESFRAENGAIVYPLCGNHYGMRVDTMEGNP